MMKQILLFITLSSIFGLALNAQVRYYDNVFSEVTLTSDIQYGTGLSAQNTTQNLFLDVYQPTGDTQEKRIAIVVAHGGSFLPNQGTKTDAYIVDYANTMAKKGYVVFAISYRLGWVPNVTSQEQSSRNVLPAAWRGIQDFKSAVRYLRKTIAADGNPYKIESSRIIGAGFGAGGYLPTNMMGIDKGPELYIPELQQKNELTGQPNGTPYIDTTIQNLKGPAYLGGPNAEYSFEVPMIGNYSGAIAHLKVLDTGDFPLIVSVHSEEDEATPYRTDLVYASGTFPIIEVSGSYSIHEKLKSQGKNTLFADEARDGYPQVRVPEDNASDNMYKNGLLTFPDQVYMWSSESDTYDQNYNPTYKAWMDSVTTYSAARFQKWIGSTTGIETVKYDETIATFSVYPNPASSVINLKSNNAGVKAETVRFVDLAGKTAHVVDVNATSKNIDISNLKEGIYYMKIKAGNKEFIQRFIKE